MPDSLWHDKAMAFRALRAGFTLVEILVVITVIVILVMITATIYQGVQIQARDTQLRDATDKVSDAVQLFMAKNGHAPVGGIGSSTVIGAGSECANGKDGWLNTGSYGATGCTVEDTLVASGYLPSGFSTGLPRNPNYGTNNPAVTVYYQTVGSPVTQYKVMVMAALQDPSSGDTTSFNAQITQCGWNSAAGQFAPRDTLGMRYGECIVYNV